MSDPIQAAKTALSALEKLSPERDELLRRVSEQETKINEQAARIRQLEATIRVVAMELVGTMNGEGAKVRALRPLDGPAKGLMAEGA